MIADVGRRLRDLARKLAEDVAADARARCPVDSGRLRESIEIRPDGDGFLVAATAPHSAAIEKGSSRNRTSPRPFLEPALESGYKALPEIARGLGFAMAGGSVSSSPAPVPKGKGVTRG